jgi:hypothetical protein
MNSLGIAARMLAGDEVIVGMLDLMDSLRTRRGLGGQHWDARLDVAGSPPLRGGLGVPSPISHTGAILALRGGVANRHAVSSGGAQAGTDEGAQVIVESARVSMSRDARVTEAGE